MGRSWHASIEIALAALSLCGVARAQAREPTPFVGSRHFELALHARSTKASARAEQAAWLTVSLPLDRAAAPRLAQSPTVPTAPAVAAESTAPAESGPLSSFQQLRALAEFSRRASAVALAVVGTAAERRRLDSLSSRARSSALLPEVRFRVVRNTDQALRWIPTTDDPYRITQADGTGLILEGSATFRLDRLLFASEEIAIERLRSDFGDARLKLEGRVLAAVLGLFQARERACAANASAEQGAQVLKALELFAELDGLTAGWFSDQAPSFGHAVWGFPEAVLGQCRAPEPPPAKIPPEISNGVVTIPVARLASSE